MAGDAKRLEALLIRRATEALSEVERAELQALLASDPDRDAEIFERVAAAIHLSRLGMGGCLPPGLRQRIEQQGMRHLAERHRTGSKGADPDR